MKAQEKIQNNLAKKKPLTEGVRNNLADGIYKSLIQEGYEARDIISISSQILSLVTSNLEKN